MRAGWSRGAAAAVPRAVVAVALTYAIWRRNPGFLTLSATWLAWRHHFSPVGLTLGVAGFFGGAPVPTAYLLATSFALGGDVKALLLGSDRAAA